MAEHASCPARRNFTAVAMPNGDARFGVAGPLVEIMQREIMPRHRIEKVMILTRAEAEQLLGELAAALRAFELAQDLAQATAAAIAERPRPYTGPYPIRGLTLAEIDSVAAGEAV